MTPPGPATLPRLGSYAKVSERGNLSPAWCTITTPEAVSHTGTPNQEVNLGQPAKFPAQLSLDSASRLPG